MPSELRQVEIQGHPFLCLPTATNPETSADYAPIREATQTFMNAVSENRVSGLMAELAAYCALSDAYLKHRERIQVLLFPKGRWPILNYVDWEVDCQLVVSGENRPIDVFNSMQHLMETHPKVLDHERWEREGRLKPVLIGRMSSRYVKDLYMKQWNSMICDVEKPLLLDDHSTQPVRAAAQTLGIEQYVYWIPRINTPHGALDGDDYNQLVTSGAYVPYPEDFAPGAGQLPERYRHKITGLLRLMYIQGFFRQAKDTRERVLSLITQNAYHYLLRSDGPVDEASLIDYAISRVGGGYGQALRREEDYYRAAIDEYFGHLQGIDFVSRYGGRIRIEDAVHPLTYF